MALHQTPFASSISIIKGPAVVEVVSVLSPRMSQQSPEVPSTMTQKQDNKATKEGTVATQGWY